MKIILFSLLIASILTMACSNNKATTETRETTGTDTLLKDSLPVASDTVLSGCYSLTANRDTASLQVQVRGNTARGSLSYNLFEKDRNDGTFEGEIANGILTGWYLFRSEGKMSVRQVAWKIQSGYLWPATSEIMVRNDTAMFKNPQNLSFDSSRVFVKVKCVI